VASTDRTCGQRKRRRTRDGSELRRRSDPCGSTGSNLCSAKAAGRSELPQRSRPMWVKGSNLCSGQAAGHAGRNRLVAAERPVWGRGLEGVRGARRIGDWRCVTITR
jgi:hypothetical protein